VPSWIRSRSRALRTAVTAGSAVLLAGSVLGMPASAAAAGHATPSLTRLAAVKLPRGAVRVGSPAGSARVSGAVALRLRNASGLTAAATAVSNPKSPDYKHYVTPAQFRAAYAPSAATIAAVESMLRAGHLSVGSVTADGTLVHFSGTAAQADAAFRAGLARYRLANGTTGTEMTGAPAFPTAIAAQVLGVVGLNTLVKPTSGIERWQKKGAGHELPVTRTSLGAPIPGAPTPCKAATRNAQEENGLTYDALAHAYGLDGLFRAGDLGAGQHIALFELAPYASKDLATFDTCYFGASRAAQMLSRVHTVNVDGGAGTGFGLGSDEAELDIEDVAAFAPKADIDVYTGPLTESGAMGYLDTVSAIVNADQDQFVSSSWSLGSCEQQTIALAPGVVDTENQLFEQAALQGQSVFASSGDSGSDECAFNGSTTPVAPFVSASDPASQPFVTGVGGTAVTNDANRPSEQVWNDGNFGGSGGGGTSALWSAPSWQAGAIDNVAPSVFAAAFGSGSHFGDGLDQPCPQADASDPAVCRAVPDVTAEADEYTGAIGVFIRPFGGWGDFGGTSSSSPLWAAMMADVQASADCASSGALGFLSPKLYAIGANPTEDAASFNDVTVGNNDMYAITGNSLFAATKGYDLASGLGSPRLTSPNGKPALAAYLCEQTTGDAPQVSSLSPAVEPLNPTGTLTIDGSGFTGATAVSIGTYQVPASDLDVVSDSEIQVTAPPAASQTGGDTGENGAGHAAVSVTGPGGTSAQTPVSQLDYVDTSGGGTVPSVTLISGDIGAQAGGNQVDVYGAGFSSGGTSNVTSVTVGGQTAPSFTVVSPYLLHVTVPAYSNTDTTCAGLDSNPAELCQTQLVVHGPHGASSTATIQKLYEGALDGSTPCTNCATSPAATEYDYVPFPTVSRVSSTYMSEFGDTVEDIHGRGLALPALEWLDFGSGSKAANRDLEVLYATPTEIEVAVNPADDITVRSVPTTMQVVTMAGTSTATHVVYAGIPHVTSVHPHAGPVAGGTTLTVTGEALSQALPQNGGFLEYVDTFFGLPRDQLAGYSAPNTKTIKAVTPQTLAGTDVVTVCSVTACSFPESNKQVKAATFVFYPAGNPVVTHVSPRKGPASGANQVTIKGHNLAVVVSVTFGKRKATLSDAETSGDASPNSIVVKAPPGTPHHTVPVQVTTAESVHAPGGAPSAVTSATTYTYRPSPPSAPRHVTAKRHGSKIHVSWRKPLVDGGSGITGYTVSVASIHLFGGGNGHKPKVVKVGPKARSLTVTHVSGDIFIVRVRAVNKHGKGPAAEKAIGGGGGGFFIGFGRAAGHSG
jgi:hypothetical protein